MRTILVTGGAGYIGSHTCVCLLQAGYPVVVVDNLSNSHPEALRRVESLAGRALTFEQADLRDAAVLDRVFTQQDIGAVIHFAGLKAVGESVEQPLRYYANNLGCTLGLLRAMQEYGVRNLVFSSSATVYGAPQANPIPETAPTGPTNPYGRTKLMIEQMLNDLHASDPAWNMALLRYFNPVGAHPSGLIGEDPRGIPNNLFPYIAQVAVGKLPEVRVFGNDYPTTDGTGVRDYIHVMDLAEGHVSALERLETNPGCVVYNLGTGRGYSVLEAIAAFSKACGKDLPYRITERRPGDIATCFADPTKANTELGWKAKLGLEDMVRDAWNWQANHPNGYIHTGK